jgi:hypothetical protein
LPSVNGSIHTAVRHSGGFRNIMEGHTLSRIHS